MGKLQAKREGVNRAVVTSADTATIWYVATVLVAVILLSSLMDCSNGVESAAGGRASLVGGRPCEEIYVVGEGETLHTISDKCGDFFIVERNPHIHDPDDVFPGLVIMLNPSKLGRT